MVELTLSTLLKRSEHNNCELDSLVEIALHQQSLTDITLLKYKCKKLQILLLHNNYISDIHCLSKLRDLVYVNLAINNIIHFNGLECCEFLSKLDLTLNFINDLRCMLVLRENRCLKELFVVGNPITGYVDYRYYLVYSLPQLEAIDGRVVSKSERIECQRSYDDICVFEFSDDYNPYTRVPAESATVAKSATSDTQSINKPESTKFQVNQGKYKFQLHERSHSFKLVLFAIPSYLSNDYISVVLESPWIEIMFKSNLFRLRVDDMSNDGYTARKGNQLVVFVCKSGCSVDGIEKDEESEKVERGLEKSKVGGGGKLRSLDWRIQ